MKEDNKRKSAESDGGMRKKKAFKSSSSNGSNSYSNSSSINAVKSIKRAAKVGDILKQLQGIDRNDASSSSSSDVVAPSRRGSSYSSSNSGGNRSQSKSSIGDSSSKKSKHTQAETPHEKDASYVKDTNKKSLDKKPSEKTSSSSNSSNSNSNNSSSSSNSNNSKKIYLEGLPYSASEADVRNLFKQVGHIVEITLPTWQDSGRLKGYGHVLFESKSAAEKALGLDGSYIQDRYIKIEMPLVSRMEAEATKNKEAIVKPPGCKTIFVKNLPYDTTEAEVSDAFKVYGPIKTIRLANWAHTKQLKGFGYVDFQREDSAEIAGKKSGQLMIKGRPIIVDFETGHAKMSYKSMSELNSPNEKVGGL